MPIAPPLNFPSEHGDPSLLVPKKKIPPKAPVAPKAPAPGSSSAVGNALASANPDAQVAAMYQPLISSLEGQTQAQMAGGDQAIQQYASSLANAMGGINYAQPYNAAIGDQAQVDAALAQFAQGTGTSTGSSLAADLQAGKVDPSAVQAALNAVNANTRGTVGLAGGLGSAELGQLVSDRAAAQEYGLQIPQIAQLNALQDIGKLNTSLEGNLQNNVDSLEADIPKEQIAAESAAATQALDRAKIAISQQNANTSAAKANISAQSAASLAAYRQALITLKRQGMITDAQYKQEMATLKAQAQASTNAYHQGELSIQQEKAAAAAGKLQSKTVNGNTVLFDPATGTYYDPGTHTPIDPNNLTAKPKSISTSALAKIATSFTGAKGGFYSSQADPTVRLSSSAIAAAAKVAGEPVGTFLKDPKAMAAAGIGWYQVNDKGSDDPEINQLYLQLIRGEGMTRQQAFNYAAKYFPGWGQRNRKSFFPKANASQGGAIKTDAILTPGTQGTGAQYISYRAAQLGLDPEAVLGVSTNEGLSGGVGDNGTSFGPFQMHIGGALPASVAAKGAQYAQQWAWSPAGINYALSAMAKLAKGLKGRAAVNAIVLGFERPANPAGDEAAGYAYV